MGKTIQQTTDSSKCEKKEHLIYTVVIARNLTQA